MRLLSVLLGLGLAIAPQVSGTQLTDCYPSCTTFTDAFSGSALDQKTPWSGTFGVDRFVSHGTRVLIGVTIKTILYFNSTVFATRNTTATLSGSITPGVTLSMDLSSYSGQLGQYWGRWGDYAELDDNTSNDAFPNQGQNGQDVTNVVQTDGNAATENAASPNLFITYTYPLFDIVGAQDCGGTSSDTWYCGGTAPKPLPLTPSDPFPAGDGSGFGGGANSGPVWAYYIPSTESSTLGAPQFYFGAISKGIYVERLDDFTQPTINSVTASQYFNQELEPTLDQTTTFVFDSSYVQNVEKEAGFAEFNRWSESLAFNKSIWNTDLPGGPSRNITPQSMLDLFDTAKSGTSQIMFDAAATGIYDATFTGGNAGVRQETYAKVAVRVEYTYTCTICGDPQFGGFQGQSFQVHGYPGSYFNLFSAPSFQMNGRFAYLATGHCNYKHTPCWTHPGTYIDDVTFVVDELLIRISAGPVGTGYSVLINDEPFHAHKHVNATDAHHDDDDDDDGDGMVRPFVPTKFYDPNTRLTIHLRSPLEIHVRNELVAFSIHNADYFFNVDSQLLVRPILRHGRKASHAFPHPETGKPYFPDYPLHGFIGQTWANKVYPQNTLYQGEPDDYVEPRPYSTESLYSQYHKLFDDKQTQWD